MREADVAIRMKEPSQADLVRRRLMDVKIKLYASREYLKKNGTPQTVEDMAEHRIITQRAGDPQVTAGAEFVEQFMSSERKSHLTVNNYFGILQASLHGLGIGALPDYVTADFPDLINVLPEMESRPIPVYLAYPEELRHSKRVTAFRDFVLDEIADYRKTLRADAVASS
jgi:DNA-binding transcriptional LysR family regulator